MKKIIFLTTIFLLLLPLANALTASIGNARMIIHTEVEEGETTIIEKFVRVNNVNDVPVQITMEPKGDLVDIIELLDESFTLEPGESKDANFIITLEYGGAYQGQIGVGFQALEGGHGVGLSSTIIVLAEGPEDPNRVEEEPEEEEPEEETPEEEEPEVEEEEETEEEDITITVGGQPAEEEEEPAKEKKASPLVGIFIILIIVGVGAIITIVVMLVLRKK